MSGARPAADRHGSTGARPSGGRGRPGVVRPEFGPTLPALLRGRGRLVLIAAMAAVAGIAALLAVGRAAGSEATPETLVHSQPDFTLLYEKGRLRRVAPQGDEYVRLEGRGRGTSVSVTVAPLPRTPAGSEPTLTDLPIETDRLIDSMRRRHDDLTVLAEGRARVNGAPGYQVRHRSGPDAAEQMGHDVLLVPKPPAPGPGLLVSLRQRDARGELAPADRRVAQAAKRAFRSFRFGTERP